MVSPVRMDSKGDRYCPALDKQITARHCGEGRLTAIDCPLSCPFNPFNPSAPKAFDQLLARGLSAASRWVERAIGPNEWARRLDALDRRFHPERDIPLITFETQWTALESARSGEAYGELGEKLARGDYTELRNDARIVIEKLLESEVLLMEVVESSDALPYYPCRDLLLPEREYLYVDFGDQEPLEQGALLFGRFLTHENCLYVVPGIFVGGAELREELVEQVCAYLGATGEEARAALQGLVPEIWNLCAGLQDEYDGADENGDQEGFDSQQDPEELYSAELRLAGSKLEAVLALREQALFQEEDPPEFGVDPLGESVFKVMVRPDLLPADEGYDDEGGELDEEDEEDLDVRAGTIYVDSERIRITALNPVELELLKALVKALAPCES